MQQKLKTFSIEHIEPYYLALTVALFELSTLLIIALLKIDMQTMGNLPEKFYHGLLVGGLGAFVAILIYNIIADNSRFGIRFLSEIKFRIKKIGMIAALGNAFFIGILFVIKSIISPLKSINLIVGNALVGFLATGLSAALLIALYNLLPNGFKLTGKIEHTDILKKGKKRSMNIRITEIPIKTALIIGLVELFILPLISLFSLTAKSALAFAISGFFAGLMGSLIGITIYNRYNLKIRLPVLIY